MAGWRETSACPASSPGATRRRRDITRRKWGRATVRPLARRKRSGDLGPIDEGDRRCTFGIGGKPIARGAVIEKVQALLDNQPELRMARRCHLARQQDRIVAAELRHVD